MSDAPNPAPEQDAAPAPEIALPPPGPGENEFGPLTHAVEVRSYVDNRGIMLQHRTTAFGVAPRAFTAWLAVTSIPLVAPNGRQMPQRIEAGFDAADLAEALRIAGPKLAEAGHKLVADLEKRAISEAIRSGARGGLGDMARRPGGG